MKAIDEVYSLIRREVRDLDKIKVEKVCIGLAYTGVKLDTGHVGVASTPLSEPTFFRCG